MKAILIFLLLLSLYPCRAGAQDYIHYQRCINRIDQYAKDNRLDDASRILDSIDREYAFVFAKHCMMGLQVCCKNEDSARAERWLSRSFLSGIPAWIIRQNDLTKKTLQYANTKRIWSDYDSLRRVYKNSVDTVLRDRIKVLMDRDMVFTNKVNKGAAILYPVHGLQWIHNNTLVHRQLKAIIEERGFPGERLIGLDPQLEDSVAYEKIIRNGGPGNALTEGQAFFMLLHYFSTARNHINPLLFPGVKNGQLPVEYYARISDYQYDESPRRRRDPCFYNISIKLTEDVKEVNARRDKIGLLSYEQQKNNKELYWVRLRNNTLNNEIILE